MCFAGAGEDVEFVAIKMIHRQLDDNADGNVDLSESSEVGDVMYSGLSSVFPRIYIS